MHTLPRIFRIAFLLTAIAALALWPSSAQGRSPQNKSSAPASIPAARQASNVAIISIKGPISAVTAKSVQRRLALAARAGADAVVIELDTPGGALGAAIEICTAIKQCPITNTVAWVNPNAYSAGSVIALACREIVCSDPATMGDALPIIFDQFGNLVPVPEHERQKATAPLLAEVVDSARQNGYDEYLVQGIVALGVELWEVENSQTHERICINRAEYEQLFGGPPPPLRPRLVSAPAGVGAAPDPTTSPFSNIETTPPKEGKDEAPPVEQPGAEKGPNPPLETPGSSPAPPKSESRSLAPPQAPNSEYKPAAPRLEKLTGEVLLEHDRESQRPAFTSADRGKWKLVGYVSDGAGPYTFKAADLIHFRIASATVRTDEELAKFFGATNLVHLDQNWSESMVLFLTNNIVRYFLIAIFLIALVMEMFHPGVILPGTVAVAALALLIAPPFLIGMANWWEIAAIATGILLLAVEVLVLPGFGIPGVLGLILLFVGLIGTFVGQGSGIFPNSPAAKSELLGGLVTVLTSFLSAGLAIYFISKNLSSIPVLNKMVLRPGADDESEGLFESVFPEQTRATVGEQGVAITPLRPAGKVQFGERIVDVTSSLGYVDAGTPVRVASADAFQVMVEPTGHSSPAPAAS